MGRRPPGIAAVSLLSTCLAAVAALLLRVDPSPIRFAMLQVILYR
jgi:hypothetical protein